MIQSLIENAEEEVSRTAPAAGSVSSDAQKLLSCTENRSRRKGSGGEVSFVARSWGESKSGSIAGDIDRSRCGKKSESEKKMKMQLGWPP
jgi:hypothetical protein